MKLISTYYKILKENENPFEVDKYFKSMVGDLGFYKYDYFVFTWKLRNSGMGDLPENELSIDLKNSNVIIGKNIIEPLIYAMDFSSEDAREYVLNWFTKNNLINNSETIKKIKETISFYIKRLNPVNFELRFEYSLDAAGLMLGDALTEKLNKEEEISESDIEKRAYEISNLMISLTNRRKNEGNKENFNEYLQKKVFNYSLKMIGGNPNIYWTWFIDKKTDNLVIRDSKPFVFRLKTCHSQIPHSPHKNDPFFYINNEIVNFIHKDSNKQINEVRNMLVSWFIKNVYSNKNFRKIYIKDYIESMSQYHGLPKKYTKLDVLKRNFKNLKSQTLDKVILQKKAKEFYDGELLNIINNATENQEYYGSNFPSQLDEQVTNTNTKVLKTVSDSYTATGKVSSICDEMHAFESTKDKDNNSVTIGGVMSKMKTELENIYKSGKNPMVSKFTITTNGPTVKWTATIVEADDAYVGFTSRGSGCNKSGADGEARTNVENGKTEPEVKKNIEEKIGKVGVMKKLTDVYGEYNGEHFHQRFWVYTLPEKYPAHKSDIKKQSGWDDFNF